MTLHRCSTARDVDGHFARGLSVAHEVRLRRHLPGCAICHARYERWLAVAALDPRVPDARRRLAAGLGLRGRPRRAVAAGALALAALGCFGLVLVRSQRRAGEGDALVARGAKDVPASSLVVYDLVSEGRPPTRLEPGADIGERDELAFAYTNPGGWRRLLVFGVDDRHQMYWFHPAWTDPATNPSGVLIERGDLLRELSEAIRHELTGRELRIFALFTNRDDLRVREVEAAVGADGQPHVDGCEVRAFTVRVHERRP
jgi:hypothetical protein